MSDLQKWAETPNDKLYEYAKNWAKRFTTKRLRIFQQSYVDYLKRPQTEISAQGLQNMWQCATWAISIRNFGE